MSKNVIAFNAGQSYVFDERSLYDLRYFISATRQTIQYSEHAIPPCYLTKFALCGYYVSLHVNLVI